MHLKKVLFVSPALHIGGMEKALVANANALTRRGHQVTVLLLGTDNPLLPMLHKDVKVVIQPRRTFAWVKKIKYFWIYFDEGRWENWAGARALYRHYVKERSFDVEIAFFRGLPVKIISGSTNKRAKRIAWVHNDFRVCPGVTSSFRNISAAKRAYCRFNHIVCVSKQAMDSFHAVIGCKENTQCIYNLLPIEQIQELALAEYPYHPQRKGIRVVAVGRFVEAKGFDRLIAAMKRLLDSHVECSLTIVGDGALKSEMEAFAAQLGLANICFAGSQANPYPYIANADLLVCSSRFEGYNLTVAEALILGIPVLSTRCTGPVEILADGEYGMIVDNSEDGLYEGLKQMITDDVLRARYREMARKRIGFFDEDRILAQIEGLFV